MRRTCISISVVTLFVACGGSTVSTATSPDDGSTTAPRVPLVHRSSADACPTDRASGNASNFPGQPGACHADSDCTEGQNGRCVIALPFGPKCTYDECFVDNDCSRGAVCTCRNPPFGNNACVASGCLTDSDCAGQYCSPSYGSCRNQGVVQFVCHSPSDLCVDDIDCTGGSGAICSFDSSRTAWACVTTACPL
jgi:hypothetical protein